LNFANESAISADTKIGAPALAFTQRLESDVWSETWLSLPDAPDLWRSLPGYW